MIYALRKLIAFVFLGGMFWFIYQDLDNLDKPWFMHALGLIAIVFAFFWLLIPMVVVRFRIAARRRQNLTRYGEWCAALGPGGPRPLEKGGGRLRLGDGEKVYFHERGTLYVRAGAGFDEVSVSGRPGDVAFPRLRHLRRKIQRVHFYLTDRRVVFLGKELDRAFALSDDLSFSDAPGGIVFSFPSAEGGEMAFTFRNPLVVADVLRAVLRGGADSVSLTTR